MPDTLRNAAQFTNYTSIFIDYNEKRIYNIMLWKNFGSEYYGRS